MEEAESIRPNSSSSLDQPNNSTSRTFVVISTTDVVVPPNPLPVNILLDSNVDKFVISNRGRVANLEAELSSLAFHRVQCEALLYQKNGQRRGMPMYPDEMMEDVVVELSNGAYVEVAILTVDRQMDLTVARITELQRELGNSPTIRRSHEFRLTAAYRSCALKSKQTDWRVPMEWPVFTTRADISPHAVVNDLANYRPTRNVVYESIEGSEEPASNTGAASDADMTSPAKEGATDPDNSPEDMNMADAAPSHPESQDDTSSGASSPAVEIDANPGFYFIPPQPPASPRRSGLTLRQTTRTRSHAAQGIMASAAETALYAGRAPERDEDLLGD